MNLNDTIAQLVAEDVELKADADAVVALLGANENQLAALNAQIAALTAAGTISDDQAAQLQAVAESLGNTHAEIAAKVPGSSAAAAPDAVVDPAP